MAYTMVNNLKVLSDQFLFSQSPFSVAVHLKAFNSPSFTPAVSHPAGPGSSLLSPRHLPFPQHYNASPLLHRAIPLS